MPDIVVEHGAPGIFKKDLKLDPEGMFETICSFINVTISSKSNGNGAKTSSSNSKNDLENDIKKSTAVDFLISFSRSFLLFEDEVFAPFPLDLELMVTLINEQIVSNIPSGSSFKSFLKIPGAPCSTTISGTPIHFVFNGICSSKS